MAIYFYKVKNDYGCFSNFSPHGFELKGNYWLSSEHYFQAQKFAGTKYEEEVRNASKAIEAAKLGRNRKWPLRKDWEEVKLDIMREAIFCKFQTHDDIRETLLSTEKEVIIEDAPSDYFWGCGADKSGKNMLGQILMEVRDLLRKNK